MASLPLIIKPPVIAHRGASAYAPENTLAAFKQAKALGATWIEFDVMLTADNEVVVFHDECLERTTNGQGKVGEVSYDYLKTLDAGSWFQPQFAQEKIPTLKEMLIFLSQNPLSANIELKAFPGKESETVQKVLAILESYWPKTLPPPLLSSFSVEILQEVRRHSPSALLGFLLDDFFPDWQEVFLDLDCASLNVNQEILDQAIVQQLKIFAKTPLFAYTVNDPQRAAVLFSWGVDAMFTDCPDKILHSS